MNASAAGAGLVSVPTSRPQAVKPYVLHDPAGRARVVDQLDKLDGFVIDQQTTRLAKLRMHVGFAARAHAVSERKSHREQTIMVTLTYRGLDDWKPEHLKAAVNSYRKWCNRRGVACRYVWVAELQERGAIHYHLIAWLPRAISMPKWDKRGWWPHGMTRTERARNAVPYLLKYLSKDASKSFGGFPRGARLYGVGGLDASLRRARSWLNRPSFVQGNSSIDDRWRRAAGGGWVDLEGCIWPSEYRMVRLGDARGLVRVTEHPRSIDAGGPFSWINQPTREAGAALSSGTSTLH